MSLVKELFDYREMLFSLVRKDLRSRYKASFLGFLWTFVNPLLQIIVYSVVFKVVMKVNIENYYYYMFTGLVPWILFTASVQGGATCIIANTNLVNKVYFPRLILPMSVVTSALVNMFYTLLVVFLVALLGNIGLSYHLVFLPIIMMIEYAHCLGISFIVAAFTVYVRDLEHILGIVLMAGFYAVPIIYNVDMLPKEALAIYRLNPMASIIEAYHDILYYKRLPESHNLVTILVLSLVSILVGAFVFEKLQKRFAEEL